MSDPRSAAARASEQRALDAQFTLDTIANLEDVFARRALAARSADGRYNIVRNIPYGDAPDQTLDFYPAARADAPVLVFIHGGFWSSMRAADFSFLADGFVPFGASLAILDYPLIPAVRMADIVESCRRAVAWIAREGRRHGMNPERIFVAGNSAGGHLVAELADRRWMKAEGLPLDIVKGGCAISGLFDLAPVAASFRNQLLQFAPEEVARFSPLWRPIDVGAPMIIAVGGRETEEFLRQSSEYANACRARVSVEYLIVEGTDHITVVLDAFANSGAELNRAMRRQMGLAV
ncbi:alpha/beta hydrolase [Terrarubrum flagellatum]|uniref:alpha/beta hydrolase n=1 Tax=Terrirubrum flagellatum TaxID=2895980 RepID=UPI0031454EA5